MNITAACDHCGQEITLPNPYNSNVHVAWCEECIQTDYALLDKLEIPYVYRNRASYWKVLGNVAKIRGIPKRSNISNLVPDAVVVVAPSQPEECSPPTNDMPCLRGYTGTGTCSCGQHLPTMGGVLNRNSFGY